MSIQDGEDLQVVQLVLSGDNDAFRTLVEKYMEDVQRQMRYFTRDLTAGDELAQDVFAEAYFNLSTFRGEAPFRHWLARIGTLVGYAFWRERKRHKRHLSLDEIKELPTAKPPEQDPTGTATLLYALMAELPEEDRLLLTLAYLEECTHEEIALRTGMASGTVGVRIHRAKRRLQKLGLRSPWKEKLPWEQF